MSLSLVIALTMYSSYSVEDVLYGFMFLSELFGLPQLRTNHCCPVCVILSL